MKLTKVLFLPIIALVAISLISCNDSTNITDPVQQGFNVKKLTIPSGASIDYAKLWINSTAPKGHNTYAHKITANWDECSVTWNSFASSFDPTVVGFFLNATTGYKEVDITSLVNGWYNGSIPNYGVLLKDNTSDPGYTWQRSMYSTRETSNPPYLEVCYTYNGVQYCDTTRAIEDVYIWQLNPDINYCSETTLYTGARAVNQEKYSLLKFDIEATPQETTCETAYAFGSDLATCFLTIPNKVSNNWGWTNQISAAGTYTWPLYAGAGQCDISKGTLVGYLTVVYANGQATITYNTNTGFTLDETHLWVGKDLLPKNNKGKYVSNPGGYNYNGQNPAVVNITLPFYVAAHAEVCGQY